MLPRSGDCPSGKLFDIFPFWGLAVAIYADGRCGMALAVAIVGPLIILVDSLFANKEP